MPILPQSPFSAEALDLDGILPMRCRAVSRAIGDVCRCCGATRSATVSWRTASSSRECSTPVAVCGHEFARRSRCRRWSTWAFRTASSFRSAVDATGGFLSRWCAHVPVRERCAHGPNIAAIERIITEQPDGDAAVGVERTSSACGSGGMRPSAGRRVLDGLVNRRSVLPLGRIQPHLMVQAAGATRGRTAAPRLVAFARYIDRSASWRSCSTVVPGAHSAAPMLTPTRTTCSPRW
jgi:hypothetical protein